MDRKNDQASNRAQLKSGRLLIPGEQAIRRLRRAVKTVQCSCDQSTPRKAHDKNDQGYEDEA